MELDASFVREWEREFPISDDVDWLMKAVLPNMSDADEVALVRGAVYYIVAVIYYKHIRDSKEVYIAKLRDRGYMDLISILKLCFPYIDDLNGYERYKKIVRLEDVYLRRVQRDIEDQNPFEICNAELGRYDRAERKMVPFTAENFCHSLFLLVRAIDAMANKLYVNWYMVRPVDYFGYQDTSLYQDTVAAMASGSLRHWDGIAQDPELVRLRHLSLKDIYEACSTLLYRNVLGIKWLMYEEGGRTFFAHVNYLGLVRPETGAPWSFPMWTTLSDSEKDVIEQSYLDLPERVQKYIIWNYELRNEDEMQFDDDEEKQDRSALTTNHERGFQRIGMEKLYAFVLTAVQRFRKTYFGRTLELRMDQYNAEWTAFLREQRVERFPFAIKHVYNYAKALCSKRKGAELVPLPKHFWALSPDDADLFIRRLNRRETDEELGWFSVTGNLERLFPDESRARRREMNELLAEFISNKLVDAVFEALILRGKLSQVHIEEPYFDSVIKQWSNEERVERMAPILNGCRTSFAATVDRPRTAFFYYLNQEVYADEYIQTLLNTRSKIKYYMYFSMSWMAQVRLFFKLMNCRVMYITGATGTGKSTQVPKLLYYGYLLFDLDEGAKVITTMPRMQPTESSAGWVSRELGLPIYRYEDPDNPTKETGQTDNYQMQFKHSKAKHVKRNERTYMMFVTDGTLRNELLSNPLLTNSYSTVVIDEVHEHTPNMDIILTLMRTTCYYNNTKRLAMVTATMDYDEPTYRRFYRDINDNTRAPIEWDLGKYGLDRVNIDRRVDVTEPGMTTQYVIEEHFVDKPLERDTYEQNERDGLAKVLELARTTDSGDILLFSVGRRQILKLVESMNKDLPPNFVALPFYSEMTKEWKDRIMKLDNNKHLIQFPRERIVRAVEDLSDADFSSPTNHPGFERAVIVATNVAEASITIDSLRYVVDTGFANTARYNVFKNRNSLVMEKISDSSRLQRKGRVGRVADGFAFYMYPRERDPKEITIRKIIGEKIGLKICYSDISDTLYDLMLANPPVLLTPEQLERQDQQNQLDQPRDGPLVHPEEDISNIYARDPERVFAFISRNPGFESFLRSDGAIPWYGSRQQYDYDFAGRNELIHPLYVEPGPGQTKVARYGPYSVIDPCGTFYIVHPYEKYIIRDFMSGRIVRALDYDKSANEDDLKIGQNAFVNETNVVNLGYMQEYLRIMYFDYRLDYKASQPLQQVYGDRCELNIESLRIRKNRLGMHLVNVLTNRLKGVSVGRTTLSLNDLRVLYYANMYDVAQEAAKVLCGFLITGGQFDKLYPSRMPVPETFSQVVEMLGVFEKMEKELGFLKVFSRDFQIESEDDIRAAYFAGERGGVYDQLAELEATGTFEDSANEVIAKYLNDRVRDIIREDLYQNSGRIKQWAYQNKLSKDIVEPYLRQYNMRKTLVGVAERSFRADKYADQNVSIVRKVYNAFVMAYAHNLVLDGINVITDVRISEKYHSVIYRTFNRLDDSKLEFTSRVVLDDLMARAPRVRTFYLNKLEGAYDRSELVAEEAGPLDPMEKEASGKKQRGGAPLVELPTHEVLRLDGIRDKHLYDGFAYGNGHLYGKLRGEHGPTYVQLPPSI